MSMNPLKVRWRYNVLERDGIVAKLMAAARKLVLNDYTFPPCTQSDLLKSQWWDPIPGLGSFLAEECEFSDEYRTWSRDLFSAFCDYCDQYDLEKPSIPWMVCGTQSLSRPRTISSS